MSKTAALWVIKDRGYAPGHLLDMQPLGGDTFSVFRLHTHSDLYSPEKQAILREIDNLKIEERSVEQRFRWCRSDNEAVLTRTPIRFGTYVFCRILVHRFLKGMSALSAASAVLIWSQCW